jgi:excisionase family DNA binding protein
MMSYGNSDFLMTAHEVAKRLRIGVSTVWAMVARGDLPQPIRLGSGTTRWRSSDIDLVINSKKSSI